MYLEELKVSDITSSGQNGLVIHLEWHHEIILQKNLEKLEIKIFEILTKKSTNIFSCEYFITFIIRCKSVNLAKDP